MRSSSFLPSLLILLLLVLGQGSAVKRVDVGSMPMLEDINLASENHQVHPLIMICVVKLALTNYLYFTPQTLINVKPSMEITRPTLHAAIVGDALPSGLTRDSVIVERDGWVSFHDVIVPSTGIVDSSKERSPISVLTINLVLMLFCLGECRSIWWKKLEQVISFLQEERVNSYSCPCWLQPWPSSFPLQYPPLTP